MYIDLYRFRFVTVLQIFVFLDCCLLEALMMYFLFWGDCHVLLDQGICFESSVVDSG